MNKTETKAIWNVSFERFLKQANGRKLLTICLEVCERKPVKETKRYQEKIRLFTANSVWKTSSTKVILFDTAPAPSASCFYWFLEEKKIVWSNILTEGLNTSLDYFWVAMVVVTVCLDASVLCIARVLFDVALLFSVRWDSYNSYSFYYLLLICFHLFPWNKIKDKSKNMLRCNN